MCPYGAKPLTNLRQAREKWSATTRRATLAEPTRRLTPYKSGLRRRETLEELPAPNPD